MSEYSQQGYDPGQQGQQQSYDPNQQQQGQQEQDVTIDTEEYATEEQMEASLDELTGDGWDQESEPSEDGGAYA